MALGITLAVISSLLSWRLRVIILGIALLQAVHWLLRSSLNFYTVERTAIHFLALALCGYIIAMCARERHLLYAVLPAFIVFMVIVGGLAYISWSQYTMIGTLGLGHELFIVKSIVILLLNLLIPVTLGGWLYVKRTALASLNFY